MSVRNANLPSPKEKQPSRLETVLAAGLQQLAIDKAATAPKQAVVPRRPLGPSKGIVKQDRKAKDALEQAIKTLRSGVTIDTEAAAVAECFEFMDTFLPADGSFESTVVLLSLGVVRYLEQNGIAEAPLSSQFYEAASLYLAYLTVAADLPSGVELRSKGASTDVLFDERHQAQAKRAVLEDVSLAALLQEYFADIGSFVSHVKEGDWQTVKKDVAKMLPALLDLALHLVQFVPESWEAGKMIKELNSNFDLFQAIANVFPSSVQVAFSGLFYEVGPRELLAQYSIDWYNSDFLPSMARKASNAFQAAKELRPLGALGALFFAEIRTKNTTFQTLLKLAWKLDVTLPPLARIGISLSAIVCRAVIQSQRYQINRVKTYFARNSLEEGKKWQRELDKAAILDLTLTGMTRGDRLTQSKILVKRWEEIQEEAKQTRAPTLETPGLIRTLNDVTAGYMEVLLVGRYALQYGWYRWRLKQRIEELDQVIKDMLVLQGFYSPAQMAAAQAAIAAEDNPLPDVPDPPMPPDPDDNPLPGDNINFPED